MWLTFRLPTGSLLRRAIGLLEPFAVFNAEGQLGVFWFFTLIEDAHGPGQEIGLGTSGLRPQARNSGRGWARCRNHHSGLRALLGAGRSDIWS